MPTRRVANLLAASVILHAVTAFSAPPPADPGAPAAPKPPANWAEEVLDKDPLATKDRITREDLDQALQDPERRDRVIADYFSRADLNREEQLDFLRQALAHESESVRTQASEKILFLGLMQDLVFDQMVAMLHSDQPALRRAALVALDRFDRSGWTGDTLEEYVEILLDALQSDDPVARDAALHSFEGLGPAALPFLWKQLSSDDPARRAAAAEALSRLGEPTMGDRYRAEPRAAAPGPEVEPEPPPKAAAPPRSPAVRKPEEKKPEEVRVYFGTNREILPGEATAITARSFTIPGVLLLFSLVVLVAWWRPRARKTNQPRRRLRTLIVTVTCVVTAGASIIALNDSWKRVWSEFTGTKFGARRNSAGVIYYGYCDVSIPPTHEVGKVEQPAFGVEDESEHVILRRTELLDDEQFYTTVRELLARLPASGRDCFVFVHGYNVTFDQAARRTAQIHFDLKFHGAPLFYSWPSRGDFRHYFSDRNEIGYSQALIRQFLVDVARRVNAERIHVVAHSMGADAVCRAIAEIDEGQQLFHQIILAAPDIDADVFRSQIAPRITSKARRTTLYCSRNDLALHASYAFNDSWRAGDSSRGILVLAGLDTIDASGIDTDLLGHSYYGDCLPILHDVEQLVKKNLAPSDRHLRAIPLLERMVYWTFADDKAEPQPPAEETL